MAKFVVTDPVILFAGGTITTSCASVTINIEADDVETTAFGSAGGWRTRIGGLKQGTVDFEFHQDMAGGAIDATVYPYLGSTAAVKVRPGGTAAIGTSNPEYQFDVLVSAWNPIDSAVGDLATVSVSWPITGAVTRATA
jgi:hypothetical protein